MIRKYFTWESETDRLKDKSFNFMNGNKPIVQGEDAVELLDSSRILAALSPVNRQRLSRLDILETIDSTNCYAWAQQGLAGSFACLAEYQWAGRGRQGRQWLSPYGSGLCLSIKHPYVDEPLFPLDGLSIALAVSIVQVLQRLGINELGLKWPNDILWRKRKLAGLLLESSYKKNLCEVVVGVGINVKVPFTQLINQPWVDLQTIQGRVAISRNLLAAKLIEGCLDTLTTFPYKGLTTFMPAWQRLDLLSGQQVTLLNTTQDLMSGIVQGIDEQGALWLKTSRGTQRFVCGEVKVQWSS